LVLAEREITIPTFDEYHRPGEQYAGPMELAAQIAAERKPGDAIADMVRRLAQLPLEFQPGSAWQYGPATDVLGRLVRCCLA
jgi:hypothetical protein